MPNIEALLFRCSYQGTHKNSLVMIEVDYGLWVTNIFKLKLKIIFIIKKLLNVIQKTIEKGNTESPKYLWQTFSFKYVFFGHPFYK